MVVILAGLIVSDSHTGRLLLHGLLGLVPVEVHLMSDGRVWANDRLLNDDVHR